MHIRNIRRFDKCQNVLNIYIYISKAILIVLVVIGHIFLTGSLHNFIYTFHMPAFFIISGMFITTKGRTITSLIKKKFYTLIIPFIFFEVIGSFVYIIRYGFTQSIFGFAYNSLTLHCNTGADWFLVTLFFAEILFIIMQKTIRSKSANIIISIVAVLLALVLPNDHFFNIARRILVAVGFLSFGFYCSDFIKKDNHILSLISFALTIVVTALNGSVGMSDMVLNNPFLFFGGSITGTYFIIQLSKRIKFAPLNYVGKNTLIVMGTHQAILLPIRYYFNIPEFSLYSGLIVLILVILLEFPIIYLFNRFIPFLVGKKLPCKAA